MRLYYNGVEITDRVNIESATHRDVSDGRFDCLELVFGDGTLWKYWNPSIDDEIELVHNGYTTGKLYLSSVAPYGNKFRVFATSGKLACRKASSVCYSDYSIAMLMSVVASNCGMKWNLYGIDGSNKYEYLIQNSESAPGFLNRIINAEGGVLKSIAGRLAGIGIEYAQDRECINRISLNGDEDGVQYINLPHMKCKSVTIVTPNFKVVANDDSVEDGYDKTLCNTPVTDIITAARWARGILLNHNRKAEMLTINTELNIGMTAMTRVDVDSIGTIGGEWIADEVKHDFINEKTCVNLYRCVRTIV